MLGALRDDRAGFAGRDRPGRLGAGMAGLAPEVPIVVRARYVSAEAEKKIKEAGGVVQLVA